MTKTKTFQLTDDGFAIVYVSESVFTAIQNEFERVARTPGNLAGMPSRMVSLRDVPAQIEFRRIGEKHDQNK